MAIVDKILLNGTSYDIQDTATLQKVENVSEAVDGKPTAEITYNETNSSLDITTGAIMVTPVESVAAENNGVAETRALNAISAVNLDGTTYGLASSGGISIISNYHASITSLAAGNGNIASTRTFAQLGVTAQDILTGTAIIKVTISNPTSTSAASIGRLMHNMAVTSTGIIVAFNNNGTAAIGFDYDITVLM